MKNESTISIVGIGFISLILILSGFQCRLSDLLFGQGPDAILDSVMIEEGPDDCFVPKKGETECLIDAISVKMVRTPAEAECQGVESTITFDTEITALDPQWQGEVVIQLHAPGLPNDGSADSGVGVTLQRGSWTPFSFGPGGSQLEPGTFDTEIEGQRVILSISRLADGSCIKDDTQTRIKSEASTSHSDDRRYDIVGSSSPSDLMRYDDAASFLEN